MTKLLQPQIHSSAKFLNSDDVTRDGNQLLLVWLCLASHCPLNHGYFGDSVAGISLNHKNPTAPAVREESKIAILEAVMISGLPA